MKLKIAFIFFFGFGVMGGGILYGQLYQQWSYKFGGEADTDAMIYAINAVVDEGGNTYVGVEDFPVWSLLKFNNQGRLVWRVNRLPYGDLPDGVGTYGLFYSQGGIYYISEDGVLKYDTQGNLVWKWKCNTLLNTSSGNDKINLLIMKTI